MENLGKVRRFFGPVNLCEGTEWRVILRFSLPIIISYLLQQFYTLSDAAICGQTLSADQVAGVSDIFPLTFFFLQFAFGCTAGFSVITANRIGSGDQAGTRRSFAMQIVLCGIISLFLTTLALVTLDPLLAWLNITPANPGVYLAAKQYCSILFGGIFFQMFYNFICSILRSVGDSVTPLVFLFLSTLLNIGLDLLFIVVFHWDAAGAAWATILAQGLSAAACLFYTFLRYPFLRLTREDFRFDRKEAADHIRQGLPLGLQFSVLAVGIIVMQSTLVLFDLDAAGKMIPGNPAQNGFGAANKLNNCIMSPLNAFGAAYVSFNAQNLGAGRHDRIMRGFRQGMVFMLILNALLVSIGFLATIGGTYQYLFLSPEKITPESIRFGNLFLYTDLSLMFILGTLFLWRSSIQGLGKSIYPLLAGISELIARIAVSLTLPALVNGGPIDASASSAAYVCLCLADPLAWLAADIAMTYPAIRHLLKGKP